jgi:hypothetical protein
MATRAPQFSSTSNPRVDARFACETSNLNRSNLILTQRLELRSNCELNGYRRPTRVAWTSDKALPRVVYAGPRAPRKQGDVILYVRSCPAFYPRGGEPRSANQIRERCVDPAESDVAISRDIISGKKAAAQGKSHHSPPFRQHPCSPTRCSHPPSRLQSRDGPSTVDACRQSQNHSLPSSPCLQSGDGRASHLSPVWGARRWQLHRNNRRTHDERSRALPARD